MTKTLNDEAPARRCAQCGEAMQHLANLRAAGLLPAVRVYRCFQCNHVLEEPRGPTVMAAKNRAGLPRGKVNAKNPGDRAGAAKEQTLIQ